MPRDIPGRGDFSVAAWVRVPEEDDDVVGTVVERFDAAARRGFQLSIVTNAASTSALANLRQVQFGLQTASPETTWQDHGRPGNAVLIFALATYRGQLYAGTCEPGAEQCGHVYRLEGEQWIDCGRLDGANSVSALAEFDGQLYAATACYRLRGSALDDAVNQSPGGRVFRLIEPGRWEDCGRLGESEALNGLVVYRGQLYASSTYAPAGCFRYEGGTNWTSLGTAEGHRCEALTVFNGAIFATSYDGAEIHRYTPETGWRVVGQLPGETQTYGFTIFQGQLFVGSWPSGSVWRYDGDDRWTNCGRLGDEKEVMATAHYNGQLYAGTLPLAAVYRYDAPDKWTDTGRIDLTPDVTYRRVWSMAVYRGRLFAGTLPSGRILSMASGACASHDHALAPGWHHLAGVRAADRLLLYVDGRHVATSEPFDSAALDVSNDAPLLIGRGQFDYFQGSVTDVRLYRRALTTSEIAHIANPRGAQR
ncbi:MAG: LamG domain-containing protein [Pirellulales bacterium]|nr:LamG domain-containing protein [Pirellulales bacterium]